MTPIERRHAAPEATLAKYRAQPFTWGRYDCARVIAHQAKKLGPKVSLAKAASSSSALGAKRALATVGHAPSTGSASCGDSGGQYVSIWVVAVPLTTQKRHD